MADLSLYQTCLQKVAINLRDGIYESCQKNPFCVMPYTIVNDIMSTSLDLERAGVARADELKLLLTSGKLQKLKIHAKAEETYCCQVINQVLRLLKSSCQELEVLHLYLNLRDANCPPELVSDVEEALQDLLINCHNLKDLYSVFSFDLKVLRNCEKLRSLKLSDYPRQPWYDFLVKENGQFQPHKHLNFFSVIFSPYHAVELPYDYLAVILRYCPELISLGYLESSQALTLLHSMGFSPSELKLRNCFWKDSREVTGRAKGSSIKCSMSINDAVLYYPMLEELEIVVYSRKTIPHLRNLKNLIYLNISFLCSGNISAAFRYVLQEIGFRLKHLTFEIPSRDYSLDLSVFLQYCPNLESLKIRGDFTETTYASSILHFPHLKRLAYVGAHEDAANDVFPKLSGCDQLTELFLNDVEELNDEILRKFLEMNSLSNLKKAHLVHCSLTKRGLEEFLLNAPQLETLEIVSSFLSESGVERAIRKTNHKVICNKKVFDIGDEFFNQMMAKNVHCCKLGAKVKISVERSSLADFFNAILEGGI